MAKSKNGALHGSLDLLVLKTLDAGPMHGWAITLHIEKITHNILRVEEGSLYPALHRMEQMGWIAAKWGLSENNRRARFYSLTAAGSRHLAAERSNWQEAMNAIALVLNFTQQKA